MKTLICVSCLTLLCAIFIASCGNDTTNNPVNPGTSNSVTLKYPSDDTTVQNYRDVNLSYIATNSPQYYRIQIDTNINFPSPLRNIQTTDTSLVVGPPFTSPHYFYWRVYAKYSNDSVVSQTRKFFWMN